MSASVRGRSVATGSVFRTRQAISGAIDGTAVDATGAAIPGASVTITDQDRGAIYRTRSNTEGGFSQTRLLAGHYQVEISSAGFAAFVANATVQVDATPGSMASVKIRSKE